MPAPAIMALQARITQAGLNKVATAIATPGGQVVISHFALGRGIAAPAAPVGYTPTGTETALRAEFVRRPVGSGALDGAGKIDLQTAFRDITLAETGQAMELGLYLNDGTLFALHSEPGQVITWVSPAETLVMAVSVALAGLPAGSVTFLATAPDLNVLFEESFYSLAATMASMQNRLMTLAVAPPP
jgi:hypothetical protein